MKKVKAFIFGVILTGIIEVSVSAAGFSFDFVGSGTYYSTAQSKGNNSCATVQVISAPSNATYNYVIVGARNNQLSSVVSNKGNGRLELKYNNAVPPGTSVRLQVSTASASGASAIRGSWTP